MEQDVLVAKLVVRSETKLVHQFHVGIELLQLVLHRRARQQDRIARRYLAGGTGDQRVPILQPLYLVHDQHVGIQLAQMSDVVAHRVVRDNLVGCGRLIQFVALSRSALYDHHLRNGQAVLHAFPTTLYPVTARESFYLPLPLVFQRRGTDHQHLLSHALTQIDLCRGDGLQRLAQSHLVGNDGLAGTHGEARPLLLVGIERHGEHLVEIFVRVFFLQQPATLDPVTPLQDIIEGVVIAAKVGSNGLGSLNEHVKAGIGILAKHTRLVKIVYRQSLQHFPTMVADAYLHPARPFIVDIDRTIVGLCHLHLLALLPHPEFHGLHVLTSAELRSLEVIAGAVVPQAVLPPIYHLVFVSRSRIDHPKLSRSILFVHHPYGKGLLLGLQLSQRDLPLLELHARRLLHIVYFRHHHLGSLAPALRLFGALGCRLPSPFAPVLFRA